MAVEFLRLHEINAVACALGPVDSVDQSICERSDGGMPACSSWERMDIRRCENFLLGSITKAV